jgi:hypothetical protein
VGQDSAGHPFQEDLAVPMSIPPWGASNHSVREWCEKREKASERLIKKCLLNILCWIEGMITNGLY